MELIDLTALMWLAESDPCATYLVEDVDGRRILWRLSEGYRVLLLTLSGILSFRRRGGFAD